MPNIVCKRCGVEGHSKCPYCRSIFQDNQIEAMLSYSLKFSIVRDYDKAQGRPWLRVELSLLGLQDYESMDDYTLAVEGHKSLLEILKKMEAATPVPAEKPNEHGFVSMGRSRDGAYPTFEEWCCDHDWVFKPGEQSSIGCGHGSKVKKRK